VRLINTGWTDEARAASLAVRRAKAAEKLWGRFGKKKRWMDENPGATEADWERYDAQQRRERIERQQAEEGME